MIFNFLECVSVTIIVVAIIILVIMWNFFWTISWFCPMCCQWAVGRKLVTGWSWRRWRPQCTCSNIHVHKVSTADIAETTTLLWEITCCMGSHSVISYLPPATVDGVAQWQERLSCLVNFRCRTLDLELMGDHLCVGKPSTRGQPTRSTQHILWMPPHCYGKSDATLDHTVLPVTCHGW